MLIDTVQTSMIFYIIMKSSRLLLLLVPVAAAQVAWAGHGWCHMYQPEQGYTIYNSKGTCSLPYVTFDVFLS